MRKSVWMIVIGVAAVLALPLILLFLHGPDQRQPVVTGPLTADDVREIEYFLSHERAALIGGEWAPHDARKLARNLRERAGGVIRRIYSQDGQYVIVDFGDRWDSKQGYDYELRRTTNGWKITGMGGYRGQ